MNETTTNSALEAILKQYETNSKRNSDSKYDEKNYFTTFLPKGKNDMTKTVRILPPLNGNATPFVEVWVHKINVNGEWKTFICPNKEDSEPCPFCELSKDLRSDGDEASKEEAKKYYARKAYVVRVIDREDEAHGPKFWRFQDNYKKTGVYDKIVALYSTYKEDIADVKTGRDLAVRITRDDKNNSAISAIVGLNNSPLSSSDEQANAWLSDNKTWRDVYGVKPYVYLEIIAKGGTPVWDKTSETYVDKVDSDKPSYSANSSQASDTLDKELSNETSFSPSSASNNDDDLPF